LLNSLENRRAFVLVYRKIFGFNKPNNLASRFEAHLNGRSVGGLMILSRWERSPVVGKSIQLSNLGKQWNHLGGERATNKVQYRAVSSKGGL
jgi:hypothetical protein